MSDAKYWMALDQVKGMGPANLRLVHESLVRTGLSMRDMFELSANEIQHEFGLGEKIAQSVVEAKGSIERCEDVCQKLESAGVEIILFFEKRYPPRLERMLKNTAPPMLFLFGNSALLSEKGAAILGDINVSEKGRLVATFAAKELALRSISVISGLAQGADMAAHVSALQYGGTTLAVLPYGMNHFKIPKALEPFFDETRIAFVSTFYPDREYSVYNSLSRNRIIAALSFAVFIVEAPADGGIFEAGKSAKSLDVPLFVAEYANYPQSAVGNPKLISEFGGIPVRGRKENDLVVPNIDKLIAKVKFSE